jgi:hypothetical protein
MRKLGIAVLATVLWLAPQSRAQSGVGGGGQSNVGGGGGTTGTSSYPALTNLPELDPRAYGADFTGGTVADASTTNGTNVVTCPNSDCNFPTNIASASYIIFATAGTGSSCLYNTIITFGGVNQTTVTGFTNANSITVSGNANTTGTATVCLAWFPKDSTSALNAWWAAVGCSGAGKMPAGHTLFSAPIMQAIAGCPAAVNAGYAYPGQTVSGVGIGSTYLMPAPIFSYTGLSGNAATNCAVGSLNIEYAHDFSIYGLGTHLSGAQTNTCLHMIGAATRGVNLDDVGWNGGGCGATCFGVYLIGATDVWEVGGANYFGGVEMYYNNGLITTLSSFTSGNSATVQGQCGIEVAGVGMVFINNDPAVCVSITTGSSMTSIGTSFASVAGDGAAMYIATGATVNFLSNDLINNGAISSLHGVQLAGAGAVARVHGSTVVGGSAGSTYAFNCTAGSLVLDEGANTLTAGGGGIQTGCNWPQNFSAAQAVLATSNIGLTSGWSTSSVATASGNSLRGRFTITGAVGSPSPTLTLTFPKAYYVAPASCALFETGANDLASLTSVSSGTPTASSVLFTFVGTPVAVTYQFDYECGP